MASRPMKSAYTNETSGTTVVYPALVKSTGYEWIPAKLSSYQSVTRLRFLPSFDERGQELDALVPDGNKENPDTCLGDAFIKEEVFASYKNGVQALTITSLNPLDRKGNPIPMTNRTVANNIVGAYNWQCATSELRTQKGYEATAPDNWVQLFRKKVTNNNKPKSALLTRCLAIQVDGQCRYDQQKNISPYLGVFQIPASALASFYENLLKRRDPKVGFVPSNMVAQADMFSCRSGYSIELSKTLKKGQDGKDSAVYTLTAFEPTPLPVDQVLQMYQPWDKLIVYPTIEDQIEFFVDLLGPEAVDFGLRESPFASYIPAAIQGAAKGIVREQLKWDQVKALPVKQSPNVHMPTPPATPQQPAPAKDNIDYGTAPAQTQAAPAISMPTARPPAMKVSAPTGDEPDEETPEAPPSANDFSNRLAGMAGQFKLPTSK